MGGDGTAVLQTSMSPEAVVLAVLGSWSHSRMQQGSLLLPLYPRALVNPSLALEHHCFFSRVLLDNVSQDEAVELPVIPATAILHS